MAVFVARQAELAKIRAFFEEEASFATDHGCAALSAFELSAHCLRPGKFFVSLALTKYTSNPAFFENVVDRLDI
jgi:hypothetical protein